MTKPLRFGNKSLRLKYKCLICIWIIFWAILDLFINPKYLFQNKSFSQTYYFKSEKKFCHFNKSITLKNKSRELREYVVLCLHIYFTFLCLYTMIVTLLAKTQLYELTIIAAYNDDMYNYY